MKTSIKKLENSIVEITIEETADNVAKYRKNVIKNLSKNADIKGFRKWAVIPENVLVRNYGEEQILTFTIDEALKNLYGEALKEHNILPLAQWEIKEVVSQSPLKVVMSVEVFPEIDIKKDYKKIKLSKTPVTVEEKDVQDAIDSISQRFTKFEEAGEGYVVKMGDKATIDTQGYDSKGEILENTNMEAYPLIIWSNVLVPGFEEQIVWAKAGDELKVDVTFPKDYHNKDFAGKKTKFDVKVISIETAVAPEFTPEFIKQLRGKDLDLEGFKALVKEEITETKETNARMQDENKLMEELLKITTLDFGPAILKNHITKVYAEIKDNIVASWAKVADYIQSLGMTEEQYIQEQVKPVAEKRLQSELILHKLQEMENVEVTDEEMQQDIEKILSRFESKDVLARLKELYVPGTKYYEELKQRIGYRKLIDTFFE